MNRRLCNATPYPAIYVLGLASLSMGCDARLGRPDYLWLLWFVPALAVFFGLTERWRTQALTRFTSSSLFPRLQIGVSVSRRRIRYVMILFAFTLLVVALTQPKIGFRWEEVRDHGIDIMIALDLSDSMLAQDTSGGDRLSRLDRAKRDIKDLLTVAEGDRIGLIGFAGAAYTECPLTSDYAALNQFVDALDTHSISYKGTALGPAILESLRAFEGQAGDSQALVLMTDGEQTTGDALSAAKEAQKDNVRIFTIGIGSKEGTPIPDGQGGLRRQTNGSIILSKLDEKTLESIANITGGLYVRSVTGDIDLAKLYHNGIKQNVTRKDYETTHHKRWHERFPWLVAMAAILLVVELFLPEAVRSRSRNPPKTMPVEE